MKLHHIAIICSDYEKSKHFYTEVLGFCVLRQTYRADRQSYKLDLALGKNYIIELFSFPNPPKRVSYPEACGLRHLAFAVRNISQKHREFTNKGLICEPIRKDEQTGKKFFFTQDPDGLPLEFYKEKVNPKLIRNWHNTRSWKFGVVDVPKIKNYFTYWKSSAYITLIILLVMIGVICFISNKDIAEKIFRYLGVGLIISSVELFRNFFFPILKLNKVGIYFQNGKFKWENINQVKVDTISIDNLEFTVKTKTNNTIIKKIKFNSNDWEILSIPRVVRSFKRKYREPYQFKIKK